jgi:ribosomal 30S subunit maturation factor RimM
LTDRTSAESYRNFKVYAIKDEISTKEDEFFIEDLVGQNVYDQNGAFVGNVLEIENYGASDIVVILEEKREYSVAFLKEIFVSVSKNKIIINREKYNEAKI